jgi:hypothetical protein
MMLVLLLGLVSYGENINSLVPSLLVTFLWIGGAIRPPRSGGAPVGG